MVHARHPQRVITLHPFEADNHILQGVVERVPHVQHAGDIGRRDDNGKCGRVAFILSVKILIFQPVIV